MGFVFRGPIHCFSVSNLGKPSKWMDILEFTMQCVPLFLKLTCDEKICRLYTLTWDGSFFWKYHK